MQFWIQKNCAFRYFDLKFVHTHTPARAHTYTHTHSISTHTHTVAHLHTLRGDSVSLFP